MQPSSPSHVSPRQLAHAVGVSESSIKRWADEGRIRLARTAGGHRRIALEEAIRFLREARLDLIRPDALGLADLDPVRAGAHHDLRDRVRDLLLAGRADEFRAALVEAYLAGETIAGLCDGPLREAMTEVGARWLSHPRGIFEEHRASARAATGLMQLGRLFRPAPTAPVAVGGAVRDDASHLSSLMAATVLAAAGFETVDLGANTPASSFRAAIDRHDPLLVWMSANHVADPALLESELDEVLADAQGTGASVLLGGGALETLTLSARPRLQVAGSMTELAAFAQGLTRALEHQRERSSPAPTHDP